MIIGCGIYSVNGLNMFSKLLECFKGTEIIFPTSNTQQEIQERLRKCVRKL